MQTVRNLLASAVERLDEDRVLHMFQLGLDQGLNPITLIEDVRKGMERVGESYLRKNYYISDLIMGSVIFQNVLKLVPMVKEYNIEEPWSVLFGTVENDIHDIGKNITIGLLRSRGIGVRDLGVDVLPEQFIAALVETRARILCMSGLITVAYKSMKETVRQIEEAGLRSQVTIIIGGMVDENVKNYVSADFWCKDSTQGVRICQSILGICDEIVSATGGK